MEKGNFPGWTGSVVITFLEPWVTLAEAEIGLAGYGDLEVGRCRGKEGGDGDCWIGFVRKEEGRRIDADEISSVVVAVRIDRSDSGDVVIVMIRSHEVDLQVKVGAFPVEASSGVAHNAEGISAGEGLSFLDGDFGEVRVEAVDFSVAEVVFHHNIDPVVAHASVGTGMNNNAVGNGSDFIESGVTGVTFDRLDVESFVELGRHDAVILGFSQSTNEAVLPGGPRSGCDSLEGAGHPHVKVFGFPVEDGGVVSWETEIKREFVGCRE